MRRGCLLALAALLLGRTALGQEPQTFVFAQMADGQGLTSEIILQNYGGIAQKGTISLFKGKGERLDLQLNGDSGSEFPFEIPSSGVLKLETGGVGDLQTGYVVVQVEDPVSFLTGSLVFRLAGSEVSVAGSPLSGGFVAFVERGTNLDPGLDGDTAVSMGVALANPATTPRTVVIRLLDAAGSELAQAEVVLDAGEHLARFIDEEALFKSFFDSQPDLDEFQGSLLATSEDGDFALTTLRQRLPSGRLSSLGSTAVGAMIQRNAGWQADVQFMLDELVRLHPDPFRNVSEAQFRQAAAQLQADIPGLTEWKVNRRLEQLAALLRDGHTFVDRFAFFPLRIVPFVFVWFSDGLFVVETLRQHENLIGARLARVGSTDTEEVLERLSTLISHENEQWLRHKSQPLFTVVDFLRFVEVLPAEGTARLAFETETGVVEQDYEIIELTSEAELRALDVVSALAPSNPLPRYLTGTDSNYRFEYLAPERTLYLQYNRAVPDAELPFSQFVAQVFATTAANPVDRFVIDLRHNTGGSREVMHPLLEGLRVRPSLTAAGKLFVLTSKVTFSAAMWNAIELKQEFSAILAGEPTGGKPNHFSCWTGVFLPHSGLRFRISMVFHNLIPDSDPATLAPDMLIPLTSTDFFAYRDPVLETILGGG